jgi:enoyl-CoA hydratase/carnithine racemase
MPQDERALSGAAKRLLKPVAECGPSAGLAAETAEQAALLGQPNHVEAVMANLEKRPPNRSPA